MDRRKKPDTVILHREKLYQEVWETPMRQLAKQYDVSDVGLAKICRKLNIPTPPRGYWAKRTSGQAVKKAPLRTLTESGRAHAVLDKSAQQIESVAKKRRTLKEQRQTERQKVQRLKAELQAWDISRRIRIYLAQLRNLPTAATPEQAEYLAWAETYADHLDPMVDFRIEALEEA